MTADEFTIENSFYEKDSKFLFENKQYIYVPDGQNGSYSNPQITFECTQLTNSDRYIDFMQSFITVLLVLTVSGTFTGATVLNAFAISLKNGYHQLFNSIRVQISGNDVVTFFLT